SDDGPTFGGDPVAHAAVLELIPVGGVRVRAAFLGRARNAQSHQQSERGLLSLLRRLGTAVVLVAMRAAVFVEGRAEAPHATGLRGKDPGLVELLFAFDE